MFQSPFAGIFQRFRFSLNDYRSLFPYAILGILAGALAALVVLAFEFLLLSVYSLWLDDFSGESFEDLASVWHFLLPVSGAVVLGVILHNLPADWNKVGVVHVIGQLHNAHGRLPLPNALVQFAAGAFALASGQSGGREGPGIHLGAAINSLLGQRFGLPNNSLRVLVACGTAAAIAAAFNTPIAGVIFAMEVIVAEYTVAGFIPVILAAVTATTITRAVAGGALLFGIPAIEMNSLLELPFIGALGFVAGTAAAVFVIIMRRAMQFQHHPLWLRYTAAGFITGLLALITPQILGMGYDTLQLSLGGEIGLGLLAAIAVAKLIATSIGCGLGLPIGIIGPSLVIGAALGGVLGSVGALLMPELSSSPAFYVLLGMSSTMAAVLNAPLAALLAVVELSRSVGVIYPAMLAIITATLTARVVYRQQAAHQMVLKHLQLRVQENPLNQLLQSTSVTAVMDSSVAQLSSVLNLETIQRIQQDTPNWCLVDDGGKRHLFRGSDLVEKLSAGEDLSEDVSVLQLELTSVDLQYMPVQATLREALDLLDGSTTTAIHVSGQYQSIGITISGIVTLEHIEHFYRTRW